ncbi:DNA primase, partial [Candidatus Roizmanbacteria bacterium CG_4_10_14_0_8_um_filter_33_9]
MHETVEEIKKKQDIVEYIGSFVTLKKAGRNYKGLCPFHQEKSPSFIVSPDRQIWHCFGSCGEGGDVIRFLMKFENLTFPEAVKELANKLNIPISSSFSSEDSVWKKKERLFLLNRTACDFYHYVLLHSKFGKKAREYLAKRNIKSEIINTFEIGYAPSSWDSLRRFLFKKKFRDEDLMDAGLVIRTEKGSLFDRFRGRLVFPLKDARGNIVGFSGRLLSEDIKQAKYINTPETLIYHKRETLFGLHLAKESIRKEKNVIVVEGEFDMISPYQSGISNIVAIKGSALTKDQLLLIKRYTNKISLALDSDEAGAEAMKRGIKEAEELDFELGVIIFLEGKDPDDAIQKDPVSFKKAVMLPVPIYDFLISHFLKKYPEDTAFSKKNIGEEIVPFMVYINNPIVQSYYIKKLAIILGVDESSVESILRKAKYNKKAFISTKEKEKEPKGNRVEMIERHCLSLLFQTEDVCKNIMLLKTILEASDFSYPAYSNLFQELIKGCITANSLFNVNTFAQLLSPQLRSVYDEIYLSTSLDMGSQDQSILKLSYEIKQFSLKRQLQSFLTSDKIENQE